MAKPGGNPIRFVELAGGTEVPNSYYEPDPTTHREQYYYNTRLNVLYLKIESINPNTKETYSSWKMVSQHT